MAEHKQPLLLSLVVATAACLSSCDVQLVAPYNSDLQQKASAMQAELAAWDISMRGVAGTAAADPRYPAVATTLNKWQGEAEAMLTLAVSNDPSGANCSAAEKAVSAAITASLPDDLRALAQPKGNASTPSESAAALSGCEAELVAQMATGIADIRKALKYCKVPWVPDSFFAALNQNAAATPNPPAAPTVADQAKFSASCSEEFEVDVQMPAGAGGAQHGQAVAPLLVTLQSIVYVESRKKAATASH